MGRISKMNSLVASSACWTRRRRDSISSRARGVALDHESLDDLGLESDVGDGLGWSVVELTDDVASELLLIAKGHERLVIGRRATFAFGGDRKCRIARHRLREGAGGRRLAARRRRRAAGGDIGEPGARPKLGQTGQAAR